jgi:predicted kinase
VDELLLAEPEVPAAERERAGRRARAHWLLALAELEAPGRRPCLVLVGGLPGTGKSVLAAGLADRAEFAVVRSDVVRKELAGLPPHEPAPLDTQSWLYSPEWTGRTYAECLRRAEGLVLKGKRALVDATFREEGQRRTFLDAAAGWGVPAALLLCDAAPETVRARLESRRGDASDADWAVYQLVAANWEGLGEDTRQQAHTVAATGHQDQVLIGAMVALGRDRLVA